MRNRCPGNYAAMVALSFQLLDCLANNAPRPWAVPSSAGASIHFGGFFVGDFHVWQKYYGSPTFHKHFIAI